MFRGGVLRLRQVSMNALWWLALARIIRADFCLFPFCSRKLWLLVPGSVWAPEVLGCGSGSLIVLFKIPDRLMAVTLSLISVSVSILSSRRLVSDVVGCLSMSRLVGSCVCWLCGVDKVIMFGLLFGLGSVSYRAWLSVSVELSVSTGVEDLIRGGFCDPIGVIGSVEDCLVVCVGDTVFELDCVWVVWI